MNKRKLIATLKIIAIPTGYALLLRTVFGISTWNGVFNMLSATLTDHRANINRPTRNRKFANASQN